MSPQSIMLSGKKKPNPMEWSCILTVLMSVSWLEYCTAVLKMLLPRKLGKDSEFLCGISYNWLWIYNYLKMFKKF